MSAERDPRRWRAAVGAVALIGAGVLTRAACAPPPVPAAAPRADAAPHSRGPSSSAGDSPAPVVEPTPGVRGTVSGGPADAPADAPLAAAEPATSPSVSARPASAQPSTGAVPPMQRQELALLASIERDLGREPPPEVHALLADYRRGADRATLIARVQQSFPGDLPLRVTVLRWIDQVRPAAGTSPAPPAPGHGTGTSWVRPLESRKP